MAKLYCSVKKSCLFAQDINFLGHHISQRGIEADVKKVKHILNWPIPKNAMEVHTFLGLVQYMAGFLPLLTDHTLVLTPLTHKMADTSFPAWDSMHQITFDAIKALVIGKDCLTTIDHNNMGHNKIYLTCNPSDH